MAGLGRSTGQSLGHGRPIGTSKRSVKVSVSVTVSHACSRSVTAPRAYFEHILTGAKENGQRPGKEMGGQGDGQARRWAGKEMGRRGGGRAGRWVGRVNWEGRVEAEHEHAAFQ